MLLLTQKLEGSLLEEPGLSGLLPWFGPALTCEESSQPLQSPGAEGLGFFVYGEIETMGRALSKRKVIVK